MKNNKIKRNSYQRKERIMGFLFVAPICLKVAIFVFGFMIYSLFMSTTDWNILAGTKNFIGFDNFKAVLQDEIFWKSIYNTVFLMLGIPIKMVLSFFIAVALNRKLRGKSVFRTIFYLPAVTSAVAIVLLWRFIYNADYGLFNNLIFSLTGKNGPNWLGDPAWVKISLIIMGTWRGLGASMVSFLAGMQNIPVEYYEVVDVEGGNALHKLRFITVPMLSPVLFYIIVTSVIGGLQAFSDQFIMTGVGPEYSAITAVYYLWQKAFVEYNMGMACSVAWILATAIMIITMIQFRFSNKWVYKKH